MKNTFFSQARQQTTNRPWKGSVKVVLGLGCLGVVVLAGLVIWGGIATFKGVAGLAKDAELSPKVAEVSETLKKVAVLPAEGCWDAAQRLLDVQVWLEKPISENVNSLKLACISSTKE